jgi:hypothetical protein
MVVPSGRLLPYSKRRPQLVEVGRRRRRRDGPLSPLAKHRRQRKEKVHPR